MESKYNSVISTVAATLTILLLVGGYFVWKNIHDENILLKNEVVEFKNLTNSLVRSSTTWATKGDVEKMLKNLVSKEDLKLIQDDLDKLGARLSAVGETIGTIKAKVAKMEASDREGAENPVATCSDGKIIDTHGYTKKPQIKELEDSNKAPVASVQFDASKEKPWDYQIYQRDYKIISVVGKKDDGQLTFQHKFTYSIPEKDKNKSYDVNLTSSGYLQVPLKNQMYWFNPVLDLNGFVGGNVYPFANWGGNQASVLAGGFDFGLSFSSYGETKADSWFRLFRLGIGYDASRNAGHFSFAPFLLNVGKPLPLITNLYIAPQVAFDSAGGLIVGVGIGPQL